jgi:hypothetical protein
MSHRATSFYVAPSEARGPSHLRASGGLHDAPFRAKRGMLSSRSARQEKDARQDKVGGLFEQPQRAELTKNEVLLLRR